MWSATSRTPAVDEEGALGDDSIIALGAFSTFCQICDQKQRITNLVLTCFPKTTSFYGLVLNFDQFTRP